MNDTVTYIRKAWRAQDGRDGFLYLHRWRTGWQYLIFSTHEDAALYAQHSDSELLLN